MGDVIAFAQTKNMEQLVAISTDNDGWGELQDDSLECSCPPSGQSIAFSIRSHQQANWFVRRLLELRQYRTRVEAWATSEIERSQRGEQRLLERFGGQLREWLTRELAVRAGRRRSVALPAGEVAFRATPATLVVTDQQATLAWVRQHLPAAIRIEVTATREDAVLIQQWLAGAGLKNTGVKIRMSVAAIKKHFAETGEVPPRTVLEPSHDRLLIR